jgi:PAS domain-containing protein
MAMDLAQVATFEFDERTKVFKFDDIFFNLYRTNAVREGGYQMSADRYFKEFIHPEDLPRVLDFMSSGEELFQSNGSAQIEHRFIRRDGEVRDIVVRIARPQLKDSKNTVVACGVSHDITELKQAKEITEAHRRCREALNDQSGSD